MSKSYLGAPYTEADRMKPLPRSAGAERISTNVQSASDAGQKQGQSQPPGNPQWQAPAQKQNTPSWQGQGQGAMQGSSGGAQWQSQGQWKVNGR